MDFCAFSIRRDLPKSVHRENENQVNSSMDQSNLKTPETLEDLIKQLHDVFSSDKVNVEDLRELMESYKSNPADWRKYAKFDSHRYTRNLVDEGNGKFNLLILCWGEGHGSSIHDHSNAHCFLKLLKGELKETQFNFPDANQENQELTKKWEKTFHENEVTYINDSIGLHRVENVSHTEGAVSLHLYSPPFYSCHCFDERTGHKQEVKMTFWSRYGEIIPSETAESKENN
ncbi:cysteine dioxygenase type 1-like isoform X2 [Hypanus sabinus]|uniref:cysteine dioxygenase type 1-like isoform X2 n=1 Tax=Hypanus sabinus TaxID=79690 RepID=UPI0028C4C09F|nr:cysteine dioxygenase type 1-like isoform X2 [Hypanus sabinus]